MKLLIKNKLFSTGQSSVAENEQGEVLYKIKGKFFSNHISKTYKKVIKGKDGKKLFYVRNKFWHKIYHDSAIIYNAKKKKIAIVSNSHILKNGYEVTGATEPIKIEGQGWNLDIILGEKVIGHISLPPIQNAKDALRITDQFVLEAEDEEDVPFLVAVVIAIDNIHDHKRRK